MKRSCLFLSLAAGLLATLAFAPSSQAGSMIETFAAIVPNGIGGSASDIELTYTGGTLGNFVSATGGSIASTYSPLTGPATTVIVTFDTPHQTSGYVDFTYTVASGTPTVSTITLSGVQGATLLHPMGVTGGSQILAIPEPASMALLGVGMVGLFTYRRLIRRSAGA